MGLSQLFNQLTGHSKESTKTQAAVLEPEPQPTISAVATVDAPIVDAPSKPLNVVEEGILEEEIIETLRSCYDPEIPVNIYDMGLIYEIKINKERFVYIKMTLTSPGCPVAGTLPPEVERKAASVEGVSGAKVDLVWEPTWTMDFMSEDAKLELGFF